MSFFKSMPLGFSLIIIALLVVLPAGCDSGGDDNGASTQSDDDDDSYAPDDDDSGGDDDDDSGDDDDDSTDPFKGIERTVISGGAIGYDGTSLQIAPDGAIYISACRGGELYLFKKEGKAGWTSDRVDSYAMAPDLVIDQNSKAHIVYDTWNGYRVRYATNKSGSWKIKTVAENTYAGADPSLALDSDGKAHVAFRGIDVFDDFMNYATNESGAWKAWTIEGSEHDEYTGFRPLIGIDGDDDIHIVYENFKGLNQIRYITNKSGDWKWEVVYEMDFYGGKDMFVEADGTIHVSFASGGDVTAYTTNAAGSWVKETIDGPGISDSSTIVVDSAGKVHIVAIDGAEGIYYIKKSGGDWTVELMDAAGKKATWASLVKKSSNKLMVSFYDNEDQSLNLGAISGSTWSREKVKEVPIYQGRGGFGIDSNDLHHIAWYRYSGDDVVYLNNAGKGFSEKEVFEDGTADSALAVDNQDMIHVGFSFSDGVTGGVAYATNGSGAFVTETVYEGLAGWFLNIDTDNAGAAYMVYRDITNDLPAYATNESGLWEVENFDDWLLSFWTNLFVDDNDGVHVSYQGYISPPLKYAYKNGASWEDAIVDNQTGSGCDAMTVLSDSTVVIAYKRDDALWVAKGQGDSFTKEQVHSDFHYDDYFADIVKDDQDNVHIIFTNSSTELFYATDMGAAWNTYMIDNGAGTGAEPQIAIDGDQMLHAVYMVKGALVQSSFPRSMEE